MYRKPLLDDPTPKEPDPQFFSKGQHMVNMIINLQKTDYLTLKGRLPLWSTYQKGRSQKEQLGLGVRDLQPSQYLKKDHVNF